MLSLFIFFQILLSIEAYPAGRTVNTVRVVEYWIVEFSGEDCGGNVHRWREEVDVVVDREIDSLEIKIRGNEQFVKKVEGGNEYATGFLRALDAECPVEVLDASP